jgi:hypothetical protein
MALSSAAASGFAADAVRYATDTLGNGAYFLPDSDGPGNDLNVPGNLTVGGTTTLAGALSGSTVNLTGGITTQSNSSFLANILVSQGVYGANSTTRPAFPIGLTSANASVAGTLDVSGSATVIGSVTAGFNVSAGNALVVGGTGNPGGLIYGAGGPTLNPFLPPMFPYGMRGGANAVLYTLNQATGGTPVQGALVTWDGSPINIQLNYSPAANALTFYNILIPSSLITLQQAGKLIAFGSVFLANGRGIVLNFYTAFGPPATPVLQFGMNPASPGGAYRTFQAIYEYGNFAYTSTGNIHANSWSVYNSD